MSLKSELAKAKAQQKRERYVYDRLMKLYYDMPQKPCDTCEKESQRYVCTNCPKWRMWFSAAWNTIQAAYLDK